MSTRCQIKLRETENNIYIYKHSDGYPEGVIPTLKPFVDRFFKNRGYDPDYLLAQIVRQFAAKDYEQGHTARANGDKRGAPRDGETFPYGDYTGWGLDCIRHDDIDYLYEIASDGQIYINGKLLTNTQYEKYKGE